MILLHRKTVVAGTALVTIGTMITACGESESPATTLSGIWQVDDYGTVLSVHADAMETYQVTELGCLPDDPATQSGDPGKYLTADRDVLTLRLGDTADRATLHIDGSVGDRRLRRLPALPAQCSGGTEPAAFDVFWQTFQENYPFFAAKGIDWQQVRETFRDRAISAEQRGDDAELFAVLREMVAPLNDAHVVVSAGDSGFFGAGRPGTTVPNPQLDQQAKDLIQQHDVQQQLSEFANGRISYADLPGRPELGYLRISAFSGYTEERTFAADSAELDRALNAIFTADRLTRLRGLILDLRINGGGSDALGLQLAARLTDHPYLAYTKQTRTTDPQPLRVEPAPAPFTGSVAILTSGSTISAGETFTQAMLDRPARTVRIGRPTQGVFSDVMERSIPGPQHQDWFFGLPNERFLTSDGRTFDGLGIPPDLPEPTFLDDPFTPNQDPAFDRARTWLT